VDFLYSLYDALVSINVPSDKARAVVDAMERDMGTTLATKQDLELLKVATRQDFELLKAATKQDLELLKSGTKQDLEVLKSAMTRDLEVLKVVMKQELEALRGDIRTLELRMTVKFGSMLFLGLGLTVAVLRIWS
jgi:hypothetical protein